MILLPCETGCNGTWKSEWFFVKGYIPNIYSKYKYNVYETMSTIGRFKTELV